LETPGIWSNEALLGKGFELRVSEFARPPLTLLTFTVPGFQTLLLFNLLYFGSHPCVSFYLRLDLFYCWDLTENIAGRGGERLS
jgi:hypothetical protein